MSGVTQGTRPAPGERVALSRHVVLRTFVDETVLMDVNTGCYYKIDREGGEMLRAVIETGSVSAAAAALARAGWGQVSDLVDGVATLCRELTSRGLLRAGGRTA